MIVWDWVGWIAGTIGAALIVSGIAREVLHRMELRKDERDAARMIAEARVKPGGKAAALLDAVAGEWGEGSAAYLALDDDTQVIRPIIVDVRPVEDPRRSMHQVVDDLGTWEPWAHEPAEPLILGDVLSWRKWKVLRPADVGMVST